MRALGGGAEPEAITGLLRTSRVSVSPLHSGGPQSMTAQQCTPPQAPLVAIDIAKKSP